MRLVTTRRWLAVAGDARCHLVVFGGTNDASRRLVASECTNDAHCHLAVFGGIYAEFAPTMPAATWWHTETSAEHRQDTR